MATNKDKVLVVLYSSKTHSVADRPQKIKIISNKSERSGRYLHRNFCPFRLLSTFLHSRGGYTDDKEPLFVYGDKTAVSPDAARKVLKEIIKNLGLDATVYDMHSFRIGRASDLIKFGYSVEEVKAHGSLEI